MKIYFDENLVEYSFVDPNCLSLSEKDYSIMVFAFPYNEDKSIYNEDSVGSYVDIFATSNHYKYIVKKLKSVALEIREANSLMKSDIQIFCNSRYPEKYLALKAGLGTVGKNSLFISNKFGNRVLIGGLIIKKGFIGDYSDNLIESKCGSCRNCIDVCPVNAIKDDMVIDRKRCLQSLSSEFVMLDDDIYDNWGNLFYGCSLCRDVCPKMIKYDYCKNIGGDIPTDLTLKQVLKAGLKSEHEVKNLFKKTVLSQSWIEGYALVRNAIIISKNLKKNLHIVELYKNHDESILKYYARKN